MSHLRLVGPEAPKLPEGVTDEQAAQMFDFYLAGMRNGIEYARRVLTRTCNDMTEIPEVQMLIPGVHTAINAMGSIQESLADMKWNAS